jgi:hypothetical protein
MISARKLIAQTVSTSSFGCTDSGLTFAVMSPFVGTHAAYLPKMTSLEVRGRDYQEDVPKILIIAGDETLKITCAITMFTMCITSACGTDSLDSETMPEPYGFSAAHFIRNVEGIPPAKDSPALLPASKS